MPRLSILLAALLALAALARCGQPPEPLPTPVPRTPVPLSPDAISPENAKLVRPVQCAEHWPVEEVAFSPDGKLLAVTSGTWLALYETGSLSEPRFIDPANGEPSYNTIRSVAMSPDGAIVATGSEDGTVQLWRPADGRLIRTLGRHVGRVLALGFSADGQTLASAGWDSRLRIWRVSDGALLETFRGVEPRKRRGERPECSMRATFSADGTLLAWACNENIGLFRVEDGVRLRALRMRGDQIFGMLSASDQVFGLAFSSDGAMLAARSMYWLRVWRLGSRGPVLLWDRQTLGCACGLAFSPDGQMLASGGLILVSVAEGQEVWDSGSEDSRPGQAVAFSPNGALFATGGKNGVRCIWSVEP